MKIFRNTFILSCALLLTLSSHAQTRMTPAGPQEKPILLRGAVAHLGNGQVIQNSVVGFDNGKITLVADATTARIDVSGFEVIDVTGKHVYPGFILANSELGLIEVGQVNASRDENEQGNMNPNVRSIIAYNTDSELIPTMRFNGILMAQVNPRGGTISGTSSVVQLDAWNWEDAVYHEDVAIHLNWPQKMFGPRWWLGETEPRKNPNYDKTILALNQLMKEADAYRSDPKPKATNLKLQAMVGLFDGSKALHIHTDNAKDIVEGVSVAKSYGVQRVVIVGGYEAPMIAEFMTDNNVSVIIPSIHRTPRRNHDDYDYPFKLPYLLQEAGIKFCISAPGGNGGQRNLGFVAGTAVTYGLEYEQAVHAITGASAEILGINDRVGTLEEGKDATLFVSTGDALDMRTNNVEYAYIQGRSIQIEGRQQYLFKKYSKKYGHETK